MEMMENRHCSDQLLTHASGPMGAEQPDLMGDRDFLLDTEVVGHLDPAETRCHEIPKKSLSSFAHVGKISLLALVAIVAFQGGLILERHRLSPSSHPVLPETMTKAAPVSTGSFTVALSWLPESSSGLRFSMPVAKLETADVVQELMDMNMEGGETGQILSQIKPTGQYSRPYDPLWSDLAPEMLQMVAQVSFSENFAKGTDEKTLPRLNKDPFSQEELVDLVAVR